jgi:hypothetical protein
MDFNLVLFALIGIAAIVLLIMYISRLRPEKYEEPVSEMDENDHLIYDETTGSYVSVEDLLDENTILDEARVDAVYARLPAELKEKLTYQDVLTILEMKYNVEAMAEEELEIEKNELLENMISMHFSKKGKNVEASEVGEVMEVDKSLVTGGDGK